MFFSSGKLSFARKIFGPDSFVPRLSARLLGDPHNRRNKGKARKSTAFWQPDATPSHAPKCNPRHEAFTAMNTGVPFFLRVCRPFFTNVSRHHGRDCPDAGPKMSRQL
jgi:hypothetical protein